MGKTLEECHKILGVNYGATEGIFFRNSYNLPADFCVNFVRTGCDSLTVSMFCFFPNSKSFSA